MNDEELGRFVRGIVNRGSSWLMTFNEMINDREPATSDGESLDAPDSQTPNGESGGNDSGTPLENAPELETPSANEPETPVETANVEPPKPQARQSFLNRRR